MSYHSIHLEFSPQKPFDRPNWFETFVGQFVKPVLATGSVKQYWFTRYGDDKRREIRFRLSTEDFAALAPVIQKCIQTFGFRDLNDEPNESVAGLGGDRFLSPDAQNRSAEARGQLVFNYLHAIAALFVDSLVGPDAEGYFRQEKNTEVNNPHGSIFESLHHLLCNTTEVVTEVELIQLTNNKLMMLSPLYAFYAKKDWEARNVPFRALTRFQVRF
jgi:hypothetical protein